MRKGGDEVLSLSHKLIIAMMVVLMTMMITTPTLD